MCQGAIHGAAAWTLCRCTVDSEEHRWHGLELIGIAAQVNLTWFISTEVLLNYY